MNRALLLSACGLAILLVVGCRKEDMGDQPKKQAMEPSPFFADGQSARPLIEGTVPRGGHAIAANIFAVSPSTNEGKTFPFKLTKADIERGHEVFEIYCSVCHGRLGDGEGMIPQRGFQKPPSYYIPRLREAAPEHFYNVITNGYGAMYSYNDRVSADDRWRIAGYIRALQLSKTP
jgi:mono/diheme cytochrome c family protein